MSINRIRSDVRQVAGDVVLRSLIFTALIITNVSAQTLNVPPRPAGAMTGTQFTNVITTMPDPTDSTSEREYWIYSQIIGGNVPDFMRTLKAVNVSSPGHTGTYYVIPDYLAVGSDADYFLTPCTPIVAQRLANRLGYSLPTRRMVNQIWTNAAVKMNPQPIAPSPEMITLPVFAWHNIMVRTQRNGFTNSFPLGALVGGNKKDVIISVEITNRPPPPRVIIYGWHELTGDPIQDLSGAHEQTYADYSHGIRLVQMSMTADGAPNTVSNVLKSATLSSLLSDEGVVPLPYYSVAPLAPVVMTHPRSQSLNAGSNVTLNALVIGDLPLEYRWQLNGSVMPGATNSSLTITNVSGVNAGSYAIVATNNSGSATSRVAVLRVRTNSFPVMFSDNFDTNTSTNWNVFWGTTNGIPDYDADWAFDYGAKPYTFNGVTALIPPAPNSPDGSTRALRLAVNQNDANAIIAAVSLYPKNKSFSGNFALKFDMWIQYPGNAGGLGTGVAGSTQHGTFGINHLGTNVNWAAPSASASDGIWFGATGEGGDSADYRSYVGNLAGTQNNLTGSAAASGLVGTNQTSAVFQTLFPSARFETAGSPGKNWVEVEVRYTNHFVMWLMDGTIIAQRTNTSTFTNGNVMLGLMDVFNSIAAPARDSFVLFDNVRVENLSPMPIRFQSANRLPNGQVSLVLTNVPGDNYFLDASTNLVSWQLLANVLATNSTYMFIDSNAPAFPTRYYRARR